MLCVVFVGKKLGNDLSLAAAETAKRVGKVLGALLLGMVGLWAQMEFVDLY